jgi:thiamine biosynthesis protein ThiS
MAARVERTMKITVNGESRDVPDGITLSDLIESVGTRSERVAVEVNLEVVPRQRYGERQIREGDAIEIVRFVGGG